MSQGWVSVIVGILSVAAMVASQFVLWARVKAQAAETLGEFRGTVITRLDAIDGPDGRLHKLEDAKGQQWSKIDKTAQTLEGVSAAQRCPLPGCPMQLGLAPAKEVTR